MTDRPALLLDLDGTLVDSVYQHAIAWHKALELAGIKLSVWRIHRRIGMSGGLLADSLARETGHELSEKDAAKLKKAHARLFAAQLPDVRPLPGAQDLVRHLTKMRVAWAVATSGALASAQPLLKLVNLPPGVPVITRDGTPNPIPISGSRRPSGSACRSNRPLPSVTASGICSPPAAPARSASEYCQAAMGRMSWSAQEPTESMKMRPIYCCTLMSWEYGPNDH